jgi:hypothetical protein
MSVKLEIQGNGKGAVDTVVKLNKELDQTEQAGKKVAASFAKTKAEAEKFAAQGDKVEQLRLKIAKLGEYVDKGALTQERANDTIARWRAQLEQANPKVREAEERQRQYAAMAARTVESQKKLATEAERAAEAQKRMGDRLRMDVETALERHKRQLLEVGRAYRSGAIDKETFIRHSRQLKQELENSTGAMREQITVGNKAFGADALSSLISFGKQWVGVGAAVAAVTAHLRELAAEREKAVEGARSAVKGEASLSQLAVTMGDTEAERKTAQAKLLAESRAEFARGTFDSRDAAGDGTFGLISASLEIDDRRLAYDMTRAGVIRDPGKSARAYSAFRAAVGEKEVGSFDDFMDKSLAASKLAPAQADEIPLAAARAGGSTAALKFSDEFTLSATAVLAKVFGTAEQGGTRLEALFKQSEKLMTTDEGAHLRGLKGIDLIKELGKMNLTPGGTLADNGEALQAARALFANVRLVEQTEGELYKAQGDNLAQQSVRVAMSDRNTEAAIMERAAKNAIEMGELEATTVEMNYQAARKERQNQRRIMAEVNGGGIHSWGGNISNFIEDTQVGIESWGGLLPATEYKKYATNTWLERGELNMNPELMDSLRGSRADRETQEEILRELRAIRQSNESMDQKTPAEHPLDSRSAGQRLLRNRDFRRELSYALRGTTMPE